MTTSALLMLIPTWAVIMFFTGSYFRKVLRTPPKPQSDDAAQQ